MIHTLDPSILREYDIRGVVGETLSTEDAHAIGRGFGTIRSAAATSPPAATVMFDSLESAAVTITDPVRHKNIRDEADQLMRQAKASLTGPDLEQVEARFALFRKRLEGHPK